jgi:hypothetical protein
MRSDDVIDVLDRLDAAGIEWRVDGGWGVDALLGEDVGRIEVELAEFRRLDTGEWPRFLVLEDEHGRIGGREVRCASARHQLAHARGRDAEALRSRIQHP